MKLGLRRPRRSRARQNPTGIQWALITGGVATVGLAIYFLSKPSQPTTAALPAPQPPMGPLPIRLNITHPTTFSAPFGSSIVLKVGQSVAISPPSPANPGMRWMFQASRNNANGIGLQPMQWRDNTTTTSFDTGAFVATAAGQYVIEASQFTPGAGGNTSSQPMNVLVTDPSSHGTLLPG